MNTSVRSVGLKTLRVVPLLFLLLVAACGSREQRAQGYYDRGMALLEKGDLVKARIELRNAIQIKEDMAPAWRGMATLEDKAQNWSAVIAALRRVVELDPKDVPSGIKLAKLLFAANSVPDALKTINTAIDTAGEKNTEALALRAAIFLRLKDGKAAVQEANKVLAIDPANLEAMVVLAAEKFSRNDTTGALETLDGIPADKKDELSPLFLRIRIYERQGEMAKIEPVLRKLIERNPKEGAFKRALVNYYIVNKRPDDAEKELRGIVAASPDDTKLGMELVSFLQAVKGPEAARTELAERIKGGQHAFPYQMAMAELDFALGKFDDSVKELKDLAANTKEPADKITAQTRLAEIYLGRKDNQAAEVIVNDILRADARSTNGLRLRAIIRIDRGQLEEAILDLRQALNDQPRSPELQTLLALALERSGSIDLADKQLSDAMKAANFAPRFGLNYVSFLQRRGLGTHAENVLSELASRNPGNPQILAALAQVKIQHEDWAAAQEIADVIRRNPNQASIADQISASVLTGQKKYDDSLGLLEHAYNANPRAVQPMYALVKGYIQAKQVDKAESFLNSVLKVNPASAEAYVLMGMTKLVKNEPDLAVKNFNAAIEQSPKNPAGYAALTDFYVKRKDYDSAMKVVQAGLQAQPSSFELRLAQAGIYEGKGDADAAIAEYESLFKDQPGSLVVANNLASLLSDKRSDQASRDRAFVVGAALAKSQVPQFKDTLGWIYYQRGDYRNAVTLLEEAAAALPGNAWVHYHLGMSYVATSAKDKGTEQLQKALELASSDTILKDKIQTAMK